MKEFEFTFAEKKMTILINAETVAKARAQLEEVVEEQYRSKFLLIVSNKLQ